MYNRHSARLALFGTALAILVTQLVLAGPTHAAFADPDGPVKDTTGTDAKDPEGAASLLTAKLSQAGKPPERITLSKPSGGNKSTDASTDVVEFCIAEITPPIQSGSLVGAATLVQCNTFVLQITISTGIVLNGAIAPPVRTDTFNIVSAAVNSTFVNCEDGLYISLAFVEVVFLSGFVDSALIGFGPVQYDC